MSETTQEIVIGAGATLQEGGIRVPLDLPPGSVITVTITIGPREAQAEAPQKPRYMGGGRINGGGA